jgi:spore coat protein CotH
MVRDTMVLFMDLVTDDDDGSINDVSNYGFWYFLYEEVLFGIITWDCGKAWLILMNKI